MRIIVHSFGLNRIIFLIEFASIFGGIWTMRTSQLSNSYTVKHCIIYEKGPHTIELREQKVVDIKFYKKNQSFAFDLRHFDSYYAFWVAELVFDPSKCSKLSMDKKREVIYELTKWSDCAADILQAWSRQDLLQILCLELGKERKYTGLTKSKIIEHLLKVVSNKKSRLSLDEDERTPKRQRKSDTTNSAAVVVDAAVDVDNDKVSTTYCKNSACKAKLSREDMFCKRCSCCICKQFDDNKDPTLWLLCGSCGMSCHLECALRDEKSGIRGNREEDKGLDGSFCCLYCEKVNDLLSSLRKQLVVAKDTRRVDILCYRLSLSQKILAGTKRFENVYGIIDEAVKKIEEDVGPLTGLPVKTARGIVNRLSSGPEVQRICTSAVETLDSMLPNEVSDIRSDSTMLAAKIVRFEDTNRLAETRSEVLNINSSIVEVDQSQSQSQSPATNCSTVSNPSSVEDETNNVMPCSNGEDNRGGDDCHAFGRNMDKFSSPDLNDTINSSASQKETTTDAVLDKELKQNDVNLNLRNDTPENGLPITPCKLENAKEVNGKNNNNKQKHIEKGVDNPSVRGKESSKRDVDCNGIGDENFEYCVKVIRWLECDGHIETTFRQKFLTWYSMTATTQEVRVVKVFIDTFIEDPSSLAGQLVDTFSDIISNKRCSTVPAGFCLKLWH